MSNANNQILGFMIGAQIGVISYSAFNLIRAEIQISQEPGNVKPEISKFSSQERLITAILSLGGSYAGYTLANKLVNV